MHPADYTPDYLTSDNRTERATLLRTVGHFQLVPALPGPGTSTAQRVYLPSFKAAIFTGGDKELDDAFAADPSQFDIVDPATYVNFCRNYKPLHMFWGAYARITHDAGTDYGEYWNPPTENLAREWDITVKRRLEGDQALWLLINSAVLQTEVTEIGVTYDVESRTLITD